jgi:hypothetical protein
MAAVVGAELYTGTILKCSLQTRAALDVIRSAVDDDGEFAASAGVEFLAPRVSEFPARGSGNLAATAPVDV